MRAITLLLVGFCIVTSAHAQPPSANAENGRKLYVDRACWQCHGQVAQGGGIAGPRLAGRVQVWAAFSSYVRQPTEEMIPYTAKVLPDNELADIFEFLRTLPPPPAVDSIPALSPGR
jgi:ubiquinol-cytochrome c reductase cytochrome c subunit